jgi:hypothetical protein
MELDIRAVIGCVDGDAKVFDGSRIGEYVEANRLPGEFDRRVSGQVIESGAKQVGFVRSQPQILT